MSRSSLEMVTVTFTPAPDVEVGDDPVSAAVGFFNADSNLDLAVLNINSEDVSIRLGNGDGTFTSAPDVEGGFFSPEALAVGNFTSDSNLDLAITNSISDTLAIHLGNGDGTFTPAPNVGVGFFPRYIAVGNFDNN